MELFISTITCVGLIGIAWGTLRTKVNKLDKDFDKLENKFTAFENRLENKFIAFEDKFENRFEKFIEKVEKIINNKKNILGEPGSPMQPNEQGRKVLEDSGFNKIYPKIKIKLFEVIEKKSPKSLYDVEEYAYSAISSVQDEDIMLPIKEYAVNNPEYGLSGVKLAASWVIRDDYAKNKNIKR